VQELPLSGYILLMIFGVVVSGIAALWVRSAYSKYSKQPSASGLTGAQTARAILDRNNLSKVRVEPVAGKLTDHYDPRSRVVRLCEGNFRSSSIAAVSVAAHEVGHAIQDASGYLPVKLRAGLFPVVAFSSQVWMPLFLIGVVVGAPLFIYPAGGHPVRRGAGFPPGDFAGGDQRFDQSLRPPHPLRSALSGRGGWHQAGPVRGGLYVHRRCAHRVFDADIPALVEPERVVKVARRPRKEW
jgi:hypothetical protein